ncbi:MAG: glycosyltransferase [Microbacterium sp.]
MIIAFGTYDTARHPRIGIVIDGLRAHGHQVTEINHPLGLSTAERVRMLQQPWRLPALAARMLSRWASLVRDARRLRRHSDQGASIDTVLVGYLGHFDVLLARRLFPRATIVLDHLIFAADTAQDRGAAGLRVRLLRVLDRRALAAADIVMTDTAEHAALLPGDARGVVVPVGARAEWFAAAQPSSAEGGATVSVVFFGLFTPLQGAPVIAAALAEALDRAPRLRVTLIGRGQDWDAARAVLGDHERATWIDWVEPERLPHLVATHDVCLGIFGTTAKALRVVPNKVYEGAAAGCAIVTSDTLPQRELLGEAAIYTPAGDAGALAEALVALATSPEALATARAAARGRSAHFAAAEIVAPLQRLLTETTAETT